MFQSTNQIKYPEIASWIGIFWGSNPGFEGFLIFLDLLISDFKVPPIFKSHPLRSAGPAASPASWGWRRWCHRSWPCSLHCWSPKSWSAQPGGSLGGFFSPLFLQWNGWMKKHPVSSNMAIGKWTIYSWFSDWNLHHPPSTSGIFQSAMFDDIGYSGMWIPNKSHICIYIYIILWISQYSRMIYSYPQWYPL